MKYSKSNVIHCYSFLLCHELPHFQTPFFRYYEEFPIDRQTHLSNITQIYIQVCTACNIAVMDN